MSKQERCPICNSIIPIKWVCNWIVCNCGHGGKAWHENIYGKCLYGNCKCTTLNPKEAVIHPKGQKDKFRTINGYDFVKLYKEAKGVMVVQC